MTWTELIVIHAGANAGLEVVSIPSLMIRPFEGRGRLPQNESGRGEGSKQKETFRFIVYLLSKP